MADDLIPYEGPPALLTEREARLAGSTSNRLLALRGMLDDEVQGGSITVKTTYGTQSQTLTSVDTEALVAFLIERDEQLLIGLNIELEK